MEGWLVWEDERQENSKESRKCKGPEAGMGPWDRERWYDRTSLTAEALNAEAVSLSFILSRRESNLGLLSLS